MAYLDQLKQSLPFPLEIQDSVPVIPGLSVASAVMAAAGMPCWIAWQQ